MDLKALDYRYKVTDHLDEAIRLYQEAHTLAYEAQYKTLDARIHNKGLDAEEWGKTNQKIIISLWRCVDEANLALNHLVRDGLDLEQLSPDFIKAKELVTNASIIVHWYTDRPYNATPLERIFDDVCF